MSDLATKFFQQAQSTQASLPSLVAGIMSGSSEADIRRQIEWAQTLLVLATPDKDGNIPLLTLHSGATGPDGKPLAGADITFPLVMALMGAQFAATELTYENSMNLHQSSLDALQGKQAGSSDTKVGGGFLGMSFSEKIHAEFSVSEQQKRTNDFRNTAKLVLKMARIPSPEPIMRTLDAFMEVVAVECAVLKANLEKNATAKLEAGQSGDEEPEEDTGGDGDTNGNGGEDTNGNGNGGEDTNGNGDANGNGA